MMNRCVAHNPDTVNALMNTVTAMAASNPIHLRHSGRRITSRLPATTLMTNAGTAYTLLNGTPLYQK